MIRTAGRAADQILPEYTIRIADRDGECVPTGTVGEILGPVRRIPGIMSDGYYKDPQATIDAWRDLWFHSGDLGYLDERGHLHFPGRMKEMIRRRGENVSEFGGRGSTRAASSGCGGRGGRDTERARERRTLKVYVALPPGAAVTEAELLQHCRLAMARFMVPDVIETVDEFPAYPRLGRSPSPSCRVRAELGGMSALV